MQLPSPSPLLNLPKPVLNSALCPRASTLSLERVSSRSQWLLLLSASEQRAVGELLSACPWTSHSMAQDQAYMSAPIARSAGGGPEKRNIRAALCIACLFK